MARIHQDRDEGQSSDPKELQLADIRGAIRALISDSHEGASWSKANALGKELVPSMAAATIIRFATGETRQPSVWTIRILSKLVDYRAVLIPRNKKLPKGGIELE